MLLALPTETKVESGTSQSKSGTSVNLSNSGDLRGEEELELVLALAVHEARAQPQQPLLRQVPHLLQRSGFRVQGLGFRV